MGKLPYSPFRKAANLLFISGQLPIDEEGMKETVYDQTITCLNNLKKRLNEAGYQMDDVVKTTVMLTNFEHFDEMNEAYCTFFNNEMPARSAFECTELAKGAKVEIEAIAYRRDNAGY